MTPPNPVTRLLQVANTSEKAFRTRFNYSKQFMVDVTAGTYTRLSDSVHESLKTLLTEKNVNVRELLVTEYASETLDAAYELWQQLARTQNRDNFLSIKPDQWTDQLSPAHFFVKKTAGSPTRFSKDLKVPPQQVRRWVSGQTRVTPESIVLALRQIGYPWVHELVEVQQAWIEAHS